MPSSLASPFAIVSRGASVVGLALLAALPLFGVRAWSVAYADRLSSTFAQRVSALTAALSQAEPDSRASLDEIEDSVVLSETASASSSELGPKRAHALARAHASSAQHGIRISSAQVLALAAHRVMPQAVPVKASALHPAGLQLRGVSAMSIGLQDGDVLTEAAGQKASSVAVVVGIVIAARGRQAPEISGKFYRAGVPFSVTVEQPYPRQPLPG